MSEPAILADLLNVRLGDHRALADVSFEAPEGSFVAIVGPNGAGKSTLLRAILGLVEASSGEARIFGRTPREAPADWIGYVPQVKALDRGFPALAIEVVVSGLRRGWPARIQPAERATALEAMESVGAAHLAERTIGKLSGGELQRVYFARAAARRPRLILLDEPAAGMDIGGRGDMYHVLDQYRREAGATIAMVTHDWDAAYHHASHVLLLNRTVAGFGPPSEALNEERLHAAFGHVGHHHAMGSGRPGASGKGGGDA